MKKTLLTTLFLMLIALVSFQCGKDDDNKTEAATTATIEGVVSYDGSAKADGAIVSLSTEPNAAKVVSRVVADENGKYSIIGVAEGTYYVSAKFNTGNTNNEKSLDNFVFETAAEVEVKVEAGATVVAKDLALVANAATGTGKIDLTDGWEYDATHSTISFEFLYDASNALFKGHFADVAFADKYEATEENLFKFDQANIAATAFTARVNLPSIETGSPGGRDGLSGCVRKTFGVVLDEADTTATGDYNATAISDPTGFAYLICKSTTAYGDGYKSICDFKFNGKTTQVELYFRFIEGYEGEDRSGNAMKYSSLQGWFEFNPLADYGISSGHLKETDVKVMASVQFIKAL